MRLRQFGGSVAGGQGSQALWGLGRASVVAARERKVMMLVEKCIANVSAKFVDNSRRQN
jgi:hypothetical protein